MLMNSFSAWMRWGGIFDYDNRKRHIAELEHQAGNPDFWNNPDEAQALMKTLNQEKSWVKTWDDLNENRQNILLFLQMTNEKEEVG